MISKLNVPFLALNLVIYAAFAVGFMTIPTTLGEILGIQLKHSASLADFRAMYSGLCLAISTLLIAGIVQTEYRNAALLLSIAGGSGLFVGRLVTLILDGPGNLYIHLSMLTEIFAVVAGIFLLRNARAE